MRYWTLEPSWLMCHGVELIGHHVNRRSLGGAAKPFKDCVGDHRLEVIQRNDARKVHWFFACVQVADLHRIVGAPRTPLDLA